MDSSSSPPHHERLTLGGFRVSDIPPARAQEPAVAPAPPVPTRPVPLAVVISTYPAYLKWLRAAVDSVEGQTAKVQEKILCCDSCEPPDWLPAGWQVIRGEWRAAAPGRNLALEQTKAPWVNMLDGDDLLDQNYAAAFYRAMQGIALSCGILYPDLDYRHEDLSRWTLTTMPPYTRRTMERKNMISTPSAWSVAMLRECGGWRRSPSMDDWATAMPCTERGWTAARGDGMRVLVRKHDDSQSHNANAQDTHHIGWNTRRFAIVCLLAGIRDHARLLCDWISTAALPPRISLHVLDDSRSPEFRIALAAMMADVEPLVDSIEVHRPRQPVWQEPGLHKDHSRVANLYSQILPAVIPRVEMVLLFEDVLPPPDGLRLLNQPFRPWNDRTGACAGLYRTRHGTDTVALSSDPNQWHACVSMSQIRAGVNPIGMVPGGFTLWRTDALADSLPVRWRGPTLGWDGNLSIAARRAGWRLTYHGNVRCEHWPANYETGEIRRLVIP